MREFAPPSAQPFPPVAGEERIVLRRPVHVEEEEGLNPQLQRYWWMLRKHVRLITVFFVSTMLVTTLVLLLLTPVYTAETTLLIEPNPPQVLDTRGALANTNPQTTDNQTFYRNFYATQHEILRSPTLASQVIQEQALEQNRSFAEKMAKRRKEKPDLPG